MKNLKFRDWSVHLVAEAPGTWQQQDREYYTILQSLTVPDLIIALKRSFPFIVSYVIALALEPEDLGLSVVAHATAATHYNLFKNPYNAHAY